MRNLNLILMTVLASIAGGIGWTSLSSYSLYSASTDSHHQSGSSQPLDDNDRTIRFGPLPGQPQEQLRQEDNPMSRNQMAGIAVPPSPVPSPSPSPAPGTNGPQLSARDDPGRVSDVPGVANTSPGTEAFGTTGKPLPFGRAPAPLTDEGFAYYDEQAQKLDQSAGS